MSCGCGRKGIPPPTIFSEYALDSTNPADWGPCFWFAFHCIAEKIGKTNNNVLDRDQGVVLKILIELLPTILPCQTCQTHAKIYIGAHPPLDLANLTGEHLQNYARSWFFEFHNDVRRRTGNPIEFTNLDQVKSYYEKCILNKDFIKDMSRYIAFAVHNSWVKNDAWKRWVIQYNKLLLLI